MSPELQKRCTMGSQVTQILPGAWRIEIPVSLQRRYRLAQMDDYSALPRSQFLWRPPFQLSLRARASQVSVSGTWGFGLWNDPFSVSLGIQGAGWRLPALPNAAWFFFAAEPNYLSFRDDLPAQGFFASVFRAPRISPLWLAMLSPLAILGLIRPLARVGRRIARRLIAQDAVSLPVDPQDWHHYQLTWLDSQVMFYLDGLPVMDTSLSPTGPLGLVIWIDNQYAAFTPDGKLRFGTLPTPEPAWIEIMALEIS